MIKVTRLNDSVMSINPLNIEMMEETPDTVIVFNSGRKIVVREKISTIRANIVDLFGDMIHDGLNKAKEG